MKESKVLIVEDDKDIRETWEMIFSNFGFSIHTAANGQEAAIIIDQSPLDIVVTDLQMPVKDGYFVLKHIESKKSEFIVWVCSGHLLSKEEISTEYKIDKILTKPFDMISSVNEIISIISGNNTNEA